MIKRVIEFLIDNWNTYFPDTKKPEKVSLLQLCGDADYKRTEKIEVFLFLNGEKIPSLVLSLGRDHEYTEILQNEYTILKKLYSTCSQSLIDTIPRPILYEKIGMSYVLVITHLSGRTMEQMTIKKRWGRKRAALFLGVMTEWLIKLNHYTSTPLYPPLYQPPLSPPSKGGDKGEVKGGEEGGGNIYPYAKSLLNEYQIYYPSSNAYRDRILNLMKDISVKTTFVHGNPAAGNILVENPPHPPLIPPCPPLLKGGEGGLGELRMVDWAVAREKGLPLSDLFIFLTWYGANYFRTGDFIEDYKMTFFDSNPFSSMARDMVYYYCERVGIDKKFILPLFYLTWIEYAVRKFRYMAVNSGYEVTLLDYNQIASDIVKHIWDNFPEPNRNLPILHIMDNKPVNIQMLFDNEKNFIP